ncbi:hypothetical protein [Bifidobacterium cuniculi]|uniref:Uncharacterized protein n=1 Tax=Bifidobacterium cuniculi TaxID=1688 RepID=A0A087ATD4_9BIFI|nr:hypothetical protein [Bifidobacterium cuniculi]KFI62034.1 hypothetical protein BCUN_1349 [Bifidobacterium cuniculi]
MNESRDRLALVDAHADDADKPLRQVVFDVFSDEDEAIYRRLLG